MGNFNAGLGGGMGAAQPAQPTPNSGGGGLAAVLQWLQSHLPDSNTLDGVTDRAIGAGRGTGLAFQGKTPPAMAAGLPGGAPAARPRAPRPKPFQPMGPAMPPSSGITSTSGPFKDPGGNFGLGDERMTQHNGLGFGNQMGMEPEPQPRPPVGPNAIADPGFGSDQLQFGDAPPEAPMKFDDIYGAAAQGQQSPHHNKLSSILRAVLGIH